MNKIEMALERARDTKALIIGSGVVCRTAEMFQQIFPGQKAVIVADDNTWEVAGKDAQKSLDQAGVKSYDAYIFCSKDFYAEWEHVEALKGFLETVDAVAIAVGSGVINDLTKYVSSLLGRRYMCVGTAASMDGFTAYGASISKDGNKQTFDCPAPLGFVMDSAIAAAAPKELAASGYADLIAKIPAGADWMIADVVGSEKVDQFAWDLVQDGLKEALSDPAAVFAGNVEKTQALADGLLMSGFAMQAIQSSRPASGTEHQFSHCWDMEDLCYGGKHVSHGFKVGIGTLISTAELEFLLEKDFEKVDVEACVQAWKSWGEMEAEIHEVLAGKPGHIARALVEAKGKYVGKDGLRAQIEALKTAWPTLKHKIREQIMPFEQVRENLRLVGAPYEPEMIGVSRERFRKTVSFIPYMRSRFTNIDVIYRLGWMDEFLERMFGEGGVWDTNKRLTPQQQEGLSKIKHVALDMDGTIYLGNTLFPFTKDFLAKMTDAGIGYSFLTNNPSKSIDDYLLKLKNLGIEASEENMYTTSLAAIDYIKSHYPQARKLFLLGTPSMISQFEKAGYISCADSPDDVPDVLVVAFDMTLEYSRLCRASWWASQGIPYIATNPDRVCPTDQKVVLVDCGSICKCIEHATGRCPDITLGKPDPNMLKGILDRHGLQPDEIAMVGDRIYTDTAMAHNAGAFGVLVLSGETTLETAEKVAEDARVNPAPEFFPPDLIVRDIEELGELLINNRNL